MDSVLNILKDEIQKQRDQITHLQDSLAAENKLKQDLFRALGEAKASNANLESRLAELDDKYRGHYEDGMVNSGNAIRSQMTIAEKTCPPVMMSMPNSPNPPPPPSYNMTVQQSKMDNPMNYLYTALQQHHSSPTGEHLLFDQTPSAAPLPCSLTPSELTSRMGKFGAPNPARSN
ncbi:hypothetical protein WR25_04268 [Diploscapter pachys]|uniref:Uncharacterized protein n=1 Tax=Diploscapter pachys TaxID=2018661 RepID=A0A2A2K190_9BILA|nr:hypothetical protein WR25_04268 [Diploscapter pachys]